MDLAIIAAKQVLQLLLMILAGAVCCKAGVFKPQDKSILSNILLYLVVPAMVIDSYLVEFDPETFRNLLSAFGLSILALAIGLAVALGLVLYLGRVPVPEVLAGPIGTIGNMNTPLSMIITGATIASSDLKKLLQNKNLFLTLGLRLLVVPAAALAVFALLGVSGMVPMVVLILEACPCVTITTVFAIRFHHDEELAAGAVVFSTLCSIITLPLYALALTAVL